MIRADVKVGFGCNNRCVFCAQGHKRQGCAQVPFDELVRRMAEGRKRGDEIVLTGGEPTLRGDIVALVRTAVRLGFSQIQIQTNGRMLAYEKLVDELVRAGVTEFSPALHGPTAQIHDGLTRAQGSFDQTVAGIKNVASRGIPLVTNSVVVRQNQHVLPELVQLLASLGVGQVQLAFVHPVGTAFELFDEVVPRLSELVEPIRACRLIARERAVRIVTEAVPLCFLEGIEEIAVEAGIPQTTVIDLDGKPFDYSAWRPTEGKSKGPVCEGCARVSRCEGPWKEYVDRYGWAEFSAIRTTGGTGHQDR